ncbi:MAG TPA: hypothetical protein VFX28_18330 [Methylomirabilota bacterium]|nr:hypothetical protein [Methylomirabilota bacterium]
MPCRTLAAALSLSALAAIAVVTAVDVERAARLAAEDGLVEWTQVALTTVATSLAARAAWEQRRAARPAALETVTAALRAGIVIGEVDLDRRLLGVKVIATRFFLNPLVAPGWRALAVLVVVGVPVALAAYALWRRAEIVEALCGLRHQPWGQVLVAGGAVFGLTEALERVLGRARFLPPNLAEESLELVAAICFVVALAARPRLRACSRPRC